MPVARAHAVLQDEGAHAERVQPLGDLAAFVIAGQPAYLHVRSWSCASKSDGGVTGVPNDSLAWISELGLANVTELSEVRPAKIGRVNVFELRFTLSQKS